MQNAKATTARAADPANLFHRKRPSMICFSPACKWLFSRFDSSGALLAPHDPNHSASESGASRQGTTILAQNAPLSKLIGGLSSDRRKRLKQQRTHFQRRALGARDFRGALKQDFKFAVANGYFEDLAFAFHSRLRFPAQLHDEYSAEHIILAAGSCQAILGASRLRQRAQISRAMVFSDACFDEPVE
jgi:hypothetical protein